ncbi:glycosyltransferase family 9 protein [Candidatus Auribacterota bacterium]
MLRLLEQFCLEEKKRNFLEKLFNLVLLFKLAPRSIPPFKLDKIKKILIIRNDNIGDLICSSATFAAIRTALPKVHLALLIQDKTKAIVQYNHHVNKIYSYVKPKEGKNIFQRIGYALKKINILKEIRKENFDLCLSLKSDFSFSQGVLSFVSGARYRLGHFPHKKRDLKYAFLQNIYVKDSRTSLTEVERCFNFLRTINISTKTATLCVHIPTEILEGTQVFLEANKIDTFIAIHIFSKRDNGLWNEKAMISLIKKIEKKFNLPIFLTYPDSASERVRRISEQMAGSHIYFISTPTMLHLGVILKRSLLYISPEGGQVHLSSALKVPTIALFFREASLLGWEPWSDQTKVLMITDKNKGSMIKEIIELAAKHLDHTIKGKACAPS